MLAQVQNPTTPRGKVIESALRLRRGDALGYDEFLSRIREYLDQVKDEAISAPPDMALVLQGRAQGVRTLLEILSATKIS